MFFAAYGPGGSRRVHQGTHSKRGSRQRQGSHLPRATFTAGLERLEPRNLLHGDHVSPIAPDLLHDDHDAAVTPIVVSQDAVVAAVSPSALLPDLTPWASQSQGFIYDWTVQGNELRLTTAMANLGTGRMELRGGATNGTTQDVYQRIYEPDGSFTDVLAGTFTYHSAHGHIHFDGFAEYRLREVLPGDGVGAILATGEKISFCLLDVQRYNTSGPGSPYFQTCGQVQGISVGWADVYDRGLPGQSIDITGVAAGNYWLEVEVDPDNHLMESNEGNNITRIQISLGGGGGGTGDAFEPNDSFAAASILAPPEDHTYDNLSIHAAGNADYYRVTASATGTLAVRLAFQNSLGDVDLYVYNASQTQLGRSISTTNSEQVSVSAVAGQFYYVRVIGYNGATNPNYSMTIDQAEGGGPTGDLLEQNDSAATARSLAAVDQIYNALSIDAANDDDYYRLVAPASGTMSVSLAFLNSQGDVNLEVYDSSLALLDDSNSTGNSELVSVAVTAGQTYYVRVLGFNGATNENYSMTIDVPEGGGGSGDSVYYLSTTGGGTLSSTNGSPSVSFIDADILQLTVLSNGQREYQMYFDGSDVGLSTTNEDIDAFALLPDGSILISTLGAFSVPAPAGGTLTGVGQDLLRFVPTSLGTTTAGQWSFYIDGSDVGLSAAAENIDAVSVLSDGRVLISTTGAFSVTGASGQDEDLAAFTPTALGSATAGSWAMYFDGSDVGLATNSNEDVNALYVRETGGNPTLHFSTLGGFSVTGASGANEDAFAFNPTSLGATTAGSFGPGLAFDGSLYGLASFNVDGFSIGALPNPVQAAAQTASSGIARAISAGLATSLIAGQNSQPTANGVSYTLSAQSLDTSAAPGTAASSQSNPPASQPSPHARCSCQQQTNEQGAGAEGSVSSELVDEWLASLLG